MSFEELGLDPRLLRALAKRGLTAPTPVQSAAIPKVDTAAARCAPIRTSLQRCCLQPDVCLTASGNVIFTNLDKRYESFQLRRTAAYHACALPYLPMSNCWPHACQ